MFPITLNVRDKVGATIVQSFNLNVENLNNAPQFSTNANLIATENKQYMYKFVVNDDDLGLNSVNEKLVLDYASLPSWLTFKQLNVTSGILIGTPNNSHVNGQFEVDFMVYDNFGEKAIQNLIFRLKMLIISQFVSSPLAFATENKEYVYIATVSDLDFLTINPS